MPVKEVQHESVSLNTVKRPFSKINSIKIVVKKVSYKSAARITVNKSPLMKDRIESLDDNLSYKGAAQNTVKKLLTKNTVSNFASKKYHTNVLPETPLENCFQKHSIEFCVERVPYKRAAINTVEKLLSKRTIWKSSSTITVEIFLKGFRFRSCIKLIKNIPVNHMS